MKRSHFKVMTRLIGLVKPLTGYMILAITKRLTGHLCAAFITIFGGIALLDVLGQPAMIDMGAAFACMAVFSIARAGLRYGEQACNHFIAFKLLALIRDHVFGALRRLCPAKQEGKDKGNLISVITSDIELLEVFYAHTISPIAIAALFSVVMVGFIGNVHPLLGVLSALAYAAVGIAIPLMISKMSGEDGARFRRKSGELSSFVLCSLRGLDETIQYGQGSRRLADMQAQTDALASDEERMKRVSGRNIAITNSVILVFDLMMLFVAAMLMQLGAIGFGGVVIATLSMMSSFGPVIALANLGSTLQNTFAAGNRVLDILDESPVVEDVHGQEKTTFDGARAEDVFFAYGDEQILSDISVDIPKGGVTGIIGRSGSGKSTLLKLMMRFWQVQKGAIRISERNVDEINTSDLRSMQSFVTQDTHLFHDSIAENLRIAKPDATQEELEAACRKASVHDFIMSLPKGYETPVAELGDSLSGGERQRIGLARAFLHDADLMLLDEPTSNLDSLNEAVILKSLKEERAGKTVVLVSHRKSTMGVCDRTYSVENGRVS
ncbi:MAG: ABC transporter ATP-binding protein [Christensenellales bacterium]|nr:ABC transporter ATP-binding protein [Christensenellales bacterium]